MSAWICSDNHINLIATFAAHCNLSVKYKDEVIDCAKDPQRIASVLLAENYRSVNHRYSENNSAEITYAAVDSTELPSTASMLKQLQCYNYQACETADYKRTLAKAIVLACIDEVVKRARRTAKQIEASAAYNAAPWGID